MRKARVLLFERRSAGTLACLAIAMMSVFFPMASSGQEPAAAGATLSAANRSAAAVNSPTDAKAGQSASIISPGTILPVILRTTIAADKVKQGQTIRAQIAQEVPLAGATIPKGSKVEGQVVEVVPAGNGGSARVSIRFDKVYSRGQMIAVTTDLRALAGFMDVQETALPDETPGEGDVARWGTTTQIGGESVYGAGGPVMSADDTSLVVGKAVSDGVLVEVRRKEGTKCRGAIKENHNPQAMWVFSSDACGVYGISNVSIEHAGRTEPVGTIVLEMQGRNTRVRSASGMLLRVIG
jgi:hypothetical protein